MKKCIVFSVILFNIFGGSLAFSQSKMVFTSRAFHPLNRTDTLNTIKAFFELKPDRMDWMYCEDPAQLSQLRQNGIKFSLALRPEIPDSGEYTTAKYRIKDINGQPYIAPWMKKWNMKNPYWGCVNNPGFQELFYQKAVKFINLGAYAIFCDDALFNSELVRDRPDTYGCFCDYCLKGFQVFLNAHSKGKIKPFDLISERKQIAKCIQDDKKGLLNGNSSEKQLLNQYEKYQFISVVKFLQKWKARVKAYKSTVLLLANNSDGTWNDIYTVFDGGIAELQEKDLNKTNLDHIYAMATKLGKNQVLSLVSSDIKLQYYLMCYDYLNGHDYLVPWDIFVPVKGNNSARYYADLKQVKALVAIFKDIDPKAKKETDNGSTWFVTVPSKSGHGKYTFFLNKTPLRSDKASIQTSTLIFSTGSNILLDDLGKINERPIDKASDSFSAIQIYKSN